MTHCSLQNGHSESVWMKDLTLFGGGLNTRKPLTHQQESLTHKEESCFSECLYFSHLHSHLCTSYWSHECIQIMYNFMSFLPILSTGWRTEIMTAKWLSRESVSAWWTASGTHSYSVSVICGPNNFHKTDKYHGTRCFRCSVCGCQMYH